MLIESSFCCLISNYNKKHENLFHALVFFLVITVYTVGAHCKVIILSPRESQTPRGRARPLARAIPNTAKKCYTPDALLPASQPAFPNSFNCGADSVMWHAMWIIRQEVQYPDKSRHWIGKGCVKFLRLFAFLKRDASKLPLLWCWNQQIHSHHDQKPQKQSQGKYET